MDDTRFKLVDTALQVPITSLGIHVIERGTTEKCFEDSVASNRDKKTLILDQELDEHSRLSCVEIKGIPMTENENLTDILIRLGTKINFRIHEGYIKSISRTHPAIIIVNFLDRSIKKNFVTAARAKKRLFTADLGFNTVGEQIFVNDYLTSEDKLLLSKTKKVASRLGFRYVWVHQCKIKIRKNDTSSIIEIHSEIDLDELTRIERRGHTFY